MSSSVTVNQPRRYTGKPYDVDGGLNLYYYGARYYDASVLRFTQIDPSRDKYPEWGAYVYVKDNPMKLIDPNGLWTDPANATKFVEAARVDKSKPYSHDPKKGVDCSQLVDNALSRMDKQGVQTDAFDNLGGRITAAGLLEASVDGNANGLTQLDYSADKVQVGDLLVTSTHDEVVSAVSKDGNIKTVGASRSQQSIIERKPFMVNDPTTSPFGAEMPKIVRIVEKPKEVVIRQP